MAASPQCLGLKRIGCGLRNAGDVLPMRPAASASFLTKMMSGRLERLYSEGWAEGWASDTLAPQRALAVKIRAGDAVVARGVANGYRDDLAEARRGLGWCAFRLRLERPAAEVALGPLALHEEVSGLRIDVAEQTPCVAGSPYTGTMADNVASFDPFVITHLSQLRACDDLLAQAVHAQGAAGFVRTTYIYLFGRSVDAESLALYAGMLERGRVAPLTLLEQLSQTQEFRARARELAAPNAPGFPFIEPAHA